MTKMAKKKNKRKKVVVIGGGTGSFTVLSGLKKHDVDLTAIVTMSDDGGSTGRLRDEYGVLPPGDIRQCLVALSEASDVMREIFTHRYDRGEFAGHNFGNIFISTLETVTGSMDEALEHVGDILKIKGRVLPVTLDKVKLVAQLGNGKILHGENEISDYQLVSRFGIKKIYLEPKASPNKKAIQAIREADMIVIGPGNLYCSLTPNFLVRGVKKAIIDAPAKKVYVCNIMNKHGHADDFTVGDYVAHVERMLAPGVIDTIVYNNKKPAAALLKKYADEGEFVVCDPQTRKDRTVVSTNLLADKLFVPSKVDSVRRTLIRHDSDKLAKVLMRTLSHHKRNSRK